MQGGIGASWDAIDHPILGRAADRDPWGGQCLGRKPSRFGQSSLGKRIGPDRICTVLNMELLQFFYRRFRDKSSASRWI